MARPPFQIEDFVGQKKVLKPVFQLQDGANARGEPMPHHLFIGASGLGKSLAARVLAERIKTRIVTFRCDETAEKIVQHLLQLQHRDFAFFDEVHRLKNETQELLYEVIDNDTVPAELAPSATGNELPKVAPVTLIFATDQPGKLLNAFQKRIPSLSHFRPYSEDEMKEIVARIATRWNMLLSPQAARQIARVCHGIPRRAEHRVKELRLYFVDSEQRQIGQADILRYLQDKDIDHDGLGTDERIYLEFLAQNGSASLATLAGHLGLDTEYVLNQIEQPLVYRSLMKVRASGRTLTQAGKERAAAQQQSQETEQGEMSQ